MNTSSRHPSTDHEISSYSIATMNDSTTPAARDSIAVPSRYAAMIVTIDPVIDAKLTATSWSASSQRYSAGQREKDRFTHVRLIEAAHVARVFDVVDRIAADVRLIDVIPAIRGRMKGFSKRCDILRERPEPTADDRSCRIVRRAPRLEADSRTPLRATRAQLEARGRIGGTCWDGIVVDLPTCSVESGSRSCG